MELGTRSEVKAFLKKGFVTVDGIIQKSPDFKIDPDTHEIAFQGKVLTYQEFYYYMLHKPAGVITAYYIQKDYGNLFLLKHQSMD